jgi:HSP20 family protein
MEQKLKRDDRPTISNLKNLNKMTLIKLKSDKPVRGLERMPYISDIFNDMFDNMITPDFRRSTVPGVNIVETDENYKLQLAAPGLAKEDFKINVENDVLTISAEKKSESSETKEKFTRKEFYYGSFFRSFTLPEMVAVENISASYENGIMVVVLPKKEEAKPKAPREIKIS